MSWIDRIQNGMTITTGDGKVYTPTWLNAMKQLEWNFAEYKFPGLAGSLGKKGEKIGTRFSMEFHFQGEFHLDTSSEFEISCNDKRPWTIAHPFYGSLLVQAPVLHVDNSGLNVSKWTGVVIETISDSIPITTVDPVDAIAIQKNLLDELFVEALLAPCTPNDVVIVKAKNLKLKSLTIPKLKLPFDVQKYMDLYNKANAAVTNLVSSASSAMRSVVKLISAPALFAQSIKNKINLLSDQFDSLRSNITSLINPGSKQIYQNMAGSVLSSMCLASSVPLPGELLNSAKALEIIDTIIEKSNQFNLDMDALQSVNGGSPASFVADAASLIALNQLINLAVANLFSIALTSKNERSIICEADTNIIILTHRFYGLDADDKNIEELMENNNLGLNSMIQIKKGTKIVYYI